MWTVGDSQMFWGKLKVDLAEEGGHSDVRFNLILDIMNKNAICLEQFVLS